MQSLPTISEAEFEVMKIIWASSPTPISTNDVIEKLAESSKWTPQTIQTLLSRLVKKNVLSYEKQSRVFVYTPLVEEKDYLSRESKSFLKRFYNGALNSMVVNFLELDQLTDNEIDELKKILEERENKGGL